MGNLKEKHATITSSDYAENISIPIVLSRGCTAIAIKNDRTGAKDISITINGNTDTVLAGEIWEELREINHFNNILIETELGHNFVVELYYG